MLTLLENYGPLLFGIIGVVLLIAVQLNDFIKTICGDDEDE